ncbi:VanZ family protein [Dellaglioa sp. L3N]
MLFLSKLYEFVLQHYSQGINHFPLIHLIFLSVDKTIFYLIVYLVIRTGIGFYQRKKISFKTEFVRFLLAAYLILLIELTVFRHVYFPWDIRLSTNYNFQMINWKPLIETIKLTNGQSSFDFVYNLYGNILWFVPLGIILPRLKQFKKHSLVKTMLVGIGLSISIECGQFILGSGISDIDDVIFNSFGTLIGCGLYLILNRILTKKKILKNKRSASH